jgi:hypothetical protein
MLNRAHCQSFDLMKRQVAMFSVLNVVAGVCCVASLVDDDETSRILWRMCLYIVIRFSGTTITMLNRAVAVNKTSVNLAQGAGSMASTAQKCVLFRKKKFAIIPAAVAVGWLAIHHQATDLTVYIIPVLLMFPEPLSCPHYHCCTQCTGPDCCARQCGCYNGQTPFQ